MARDAVLLIRQLCFPFLVGLVNFAHEDMVIQSTGTAQSKQGPRVAAKRTARPWLTILLALLLVQLAACAAPTYYTQAAAGQWELMRQREDIGTLIADDSTPPELAHHLEIAMDAQSFGVDVLGLPASSRYTQYVETGRRAVSWNVVAAPEFSLEPRTWCFLVAGCVPYRGYFKHHKAIGFAEKLKDKGYDVAVMPTTAYSTLGWFDDPLLDTMFAGGDAGLAGTIFHEMAHRQIYIKGDTTFNESFATFVEETGVRLWLASRHENSAYEDWQATRRRSRALDGLVLRYRGELDRLYATDLPADVMRRAKQQILEDLCLETGNSRPGEDSCGINNASLALRNSYLGGFCAFTNLFREIGNDMKQFLARAEAMAQTPPDRRRNWLDQPCLPVAPEGNL
jgi:predicted aminopeptidase